MNLEGSRILVTGGCGLIGSTTIDQILLDRKPEKIVIFDNLVRGSMRNVQDILKDERVELVKGDIRDRDAVMKVTDGMDAVIHMAAIRITACAAEPREAMEVMCDGTYNVVEAAQKCGVKRVLAASSASVLGMADTFPTKEDHHPYNNRTWYGASKVMLEGLLRSFNDMHGLDYAAMRYFNVYGPRMDIHGKYTEVLVRWMQRIENGESPLILGDGTTSMDFIYIEDLARANVLALEADCPDEVFNVASGVETSLSELEDFDTLIVCSSFRHKDYVNASTASLLRRFARFGKTLDDRHDAVRPRPVVSILANLLLPRAFCDDGFSV